MRADDRGASELIGFMLVVGIVVGALAMLQVAAVPAWNADVEADHSQQLRADMVGLHGDVISTSTDGGTRAAPVTLGARYSGGGVFLRPPPATGRLSTTPGEIRLRNLEVRSADRPGNPEQAVFGEWTAETRLVVYRPDYSQREEPRTHYEHATLVEAHDGEELARAGGVVEGRTIRLVALTGDVERASASRINLAISEGSVSRRSIPVNSPNGEGTVTLSTTRSPEFWASQVEDSPVTVDEAASTPGETVVFRLPELADGNYRLQLSSVHLGEGDSPDREVAYVFARTPTVAPGETAVVEARDRYGNPVANADLAGVLSHDCPEPLSGTRTDSEGRLRLSCPAGGSTFTFFEGTPVEDSVRVAAGATASEAPELLSSSTDASVERYQTVPRGGSGTLTQTQFRVSYAVRQGSTPGSDLDRVEIRLFDLRGGTPQLLTATTHGYRGATPDADGVHEGRWTTPWVTGEFGTLGGDYRVEIVAINEAGVRSECQRIGEASGCG